MARFSIYEGHMEELRKKVQKIQNKCQKLGCEFRFEEVGEEYKTYKDNLKNELTFRYVIVEAEGLAKINDWQFIGSIEHTENGNLIRKAVVDVEVPERYRTSDTYCEHCQTRRQRKDVFLVMNEKTQEFKQVGRNCLCDFTHGMSVKMAAEMASLRSVFEQYEEADASFDSWENGFLSYRAYLSTKEVLAYAWETVRGYGYRKSDMTNSTKSRVLSYFSLRRMRESMLPEVRRMLEKEMEDIAFNPESEEVQQKVEEMMLWTIKQEARTDFMNNLRVAVLNEYCDYRRFGILCALIPVYQKAMGRIEEQRTERREAEYVGEVGQRITVEITSGRCVASWDTDFGTSFLYKFMDGAGNVYMWKTGKWIDEEAVKELTGTIKAHDEYNGVKQNVMTRCKVA